MIVLSSIIQFHNHSENGNLSFSPITNPHHNVHHNITHNHDYSNKSISNHCCCNHQNDESNNNCSAHIGEYHISKVKSFFGKPFPILLFDVLFSDFAIKSPLNSSETLNKIFYKDIPINSITQDVESLRAPPILHGYV